MSHFFIECLSPLKAAIWIGLYIPSVK